MIKQKKEKLIVANLKMKLNSLAERETWMRQLESQKKALRLKNSKIIICPQFLQLSFFMDKINSKYFSFGAQNCFWEDEGAFTGEVSPKALRSIGAEFVILGHSERKKYFSENFEQIAKKINQALRNNLTPIVCLGESAEERKAGKTEKVLKEQLKMYFGSTPKNRMEKIILCYEPIWAISSNGPATLPDENDIMQAKIIIKKALIRGLGEGWAEKIRILYGGSVDTSNFFNLCMETGMDGVLVGSASLKPAELISMVKMADL